MLVGQGYSDPLLDMGSLFAATSGIPMDKFGWFYKRNGTTWSDGKVLLSRTYIKYGLKRLHGLTAFWLIQSF